MEHAYAATEEIAAAREWYRQTLISSQFLLMARRVAGLRAETRRSESDTVDCRLEGFRNYYDRMIQYYDGYHPSLEKEWFVRALSDFCTRVPRKFWGDYLLSRYEENEGDTGKLAEYIFENSVSGQGRVLKGIFWIPGI